jgi:hypothetical protein
MDEREAAARMVERILAAHQEHLKTGDYVALGIAAQDAVREYERTPKEYRTATGKVLTEEDFKALAEEAERGYDVGHLRPRQ